MGGRAAAVLALTLAFSVLAGAADAGIGHRGNGGAAGPDTRDGEWTASANKLTVVSVPDWSFEEWTADVRAATPHIDRLIRYGAIGAISMRNTEKGLEDSYATLGAGAPAISGAPFSAMNADESANGEPAVEIYRRRTGTDAGDARIVVPDVAAIERRNDQNRYGALPGLLGETLGANGIAVYVYGNSDAAPTKRRYAPLMLMDRKGTVSFGSVGADTLIDDPGRPYGVRVDADLLLERWEQAAGPCVVLIEWGDWSRLYAEKSRFAPAQFDRLRNVALRELDEFVGRLLARMEPDDELWIVSPKVHADAAKRKALLAPIVRFGPGGGPALLVSATTRRPGIVSAADVAPTLLARFGIVPPAEMIGRPMQADFRVALPWPYLERELANIRDVYRLRPILLYPFAIFEAAALLVGLFAALFGRKRAARAMRRVLPAVLLAPAAMLAAGWIAVFARVTATAQAVFVGAVFAAGGVALGAMRGLRACASAGAVTAVALLADGALGAEGMKRSVLGYDPIIGARYYGIGNEYMGALIGAVVLAVTAAAELRRRRPEARRAAAAGTVAAIAATGTAAPTVASGVASTTGGATSGPTSASDAAVTGAAPSTFVSSGDRAIAATGTAVRTTDASAPAHAAAAPTDKGAACAPAVANRPPVSRREAAALRRRERRRVFWAAFAAFALTAAYIAAPDFGANAGGAIAAAVAFGVALLRAFAVIAPRRRRVLSLAAAGCGLVAFAVVALWLIYAVLPSNATPTHIGRAFGWLGEGRFDPFVALVVRKAKMNLHLIAVSVWSKVALVGLAVVILAAFCPRGASREWPRRYPHLTGGFPAIACGALAALAFNDSGIVAAAAMIVYAAVPMLVIRLQDISDSHSS
jgi:hypothetical protein